MTKNVNPQKGFQMSAVFKLSIYVSLGLMLALVGVGCGSSESSKPANAEDMLKGIVTAQPADTPESLAKKQAQLELNLKAAKEQIASGEFDAAIAGLEEAVGFDPRHREVLLLLVQASRQRSKELTQEDPWKSYRLIVQAGGYLRTFQEAHSDLSPDEKRLLADVLFDEACSHARSKRQDEFRGSLGAAIAAGFTDAARIENDLDIKPFWDVPEMKEMLKQTVDSLKQRGTAF